MVAAGIILAAVNLELLPPLAAASDINDIVAIVVGFALGVALMVGLEYVVYDEDAEDVELKEIEANMTSDNEPRAPSESGRSTDSGKPGNRASKVAQASTLNRKNSRKSSAVVTPSFPVVFAVAVYIDAAMDGTEQAYTIHSRLIPSHHPRLTVVPLQVLLANRLR